MNIRIVFTERLKNVIIKLFSLSLFFIAVEFVVCGAFIFKPKELGHQRFAVHIIYIY